MGQQNYNNDLPQTASEQTDEANEAEASTGAEPSGGVVAPENEAALLAAAEDDKENDQQSDDPSRVSSDEAGES